MVKIIRGEGKVGTQKGVVCNVLSASPNSMDWIPSAGVLFRFSH
jgi:hypothetical protein